MKRLRSFCHSDMIHTLSIYEDEIVIKTEGESPITFSRKEMKATIHPYAASFEQINFFHLLGAFKEDSAIYLGLSTKIEHVCEYREIYEITEVKFIRISANPGSEQFLHNLERGFKMFKIYFSKSTKLHLNHQHLIQVESEKDFLERNDYVFNWIPIQQLDEIWPSTKSLQCKIIGGFVKQQNQVVLISRRLRFNVGVHQWNRGANLDGYSANTVETEMILLLRNSIISHVEIRASIPFLWSQYPDLSPMPKIVFGNDEVNSIVFERHSKLLSEIYKGKIIYVSLTNLKGSEKELTEKFFNYSSKFKLDFRSFDLNAAVKSTFGIAHSIASLEKDISFSRIENNKIVEYQDKYIRSSCKSCLDRTSVFQAFVSKRLANIYLRECSPSFEDLWVEMSHVLAYEYAAAYGEKTSITKAGKMTTTGKLFDLCDRVIRYWNSQFREGTIYDSFCSITQENRIFKINSHSFFWTIFMFIILIIQIFYLFITQGKKEAAKKYRDQVINILNHPHFVDIKRADQISIDN